MSIFKCILMIDDDMVSNFLNKQVVQELKIADHTHLSRNGEDALEFVRNCHSKDKSLCPDLILLDLKMPVMDGFEFLKELQTFREKNKISFKILVVTSSVNPQDKKAVDRHKVDGYITKPLTADKLREVGLAGLKI